MSFCFTVFPVLSERLSSTRVKPLSTSEDTFKASGQLNSLDQINEQTQKMAQQVEELNSLYTRMIEAMTTNTNRQQI